MTTLSEWAIDLHLRGRVRFGVGAVASLPELVRAEGGTRVFLVTDPGVVRSGVAGQVVDLLRAADLDVAVFDGIEPNPGTNTVLTGSASLASFGIDGTVVVPVGGGSSMDAAKVMALHAANGGEVLALGYHRDDIAPAPPVIAVPTTAGTGAETNTYGVITDEAAGRKGYVGHPSVLPAWSVLDPALTVGVPPAA
ncbi:MAG: iron-containing alcohol dehydrogenase, partial [Chloroflexota bacterium]